MIDLTQVVCAVVVLGFIVYRASGDYGVMYKAYNEGWRSVIQREDA